MRTNLFNQYTREFYTEVRSCERCGDLRLQNCFQCTQEEECTTFPQCGQAELGYYPPEFAFLGQDYDQAEPKLLFLGQIPYWTLDDNVVRWEQGKTAEVVPQHDQYEEFLTCYRADFTGYKIVNNKDGILDICAAVFDLPKSPALLEQVAYTNAAKCPNRSGSESQPNPGYTAKQVTSDISKMLANCRDDLSTEIGILNPDVIVSFDRSLLRTLEKQTGGKAKDGISGIMPIAGRDRLYITFYHPSRAAGNYAQGGISFKDRIRVILDFMKK